MCATSRTETVSFLAFQRWSLTLATRLRTTADELTLDQVPQACAGTGDPRLTLTLAMVMGPLIAAANEHEGGAYSVPPWLSATVERPPSALLPLLSWVNAELAAPTFAAYRKGLRRQHRTTQPGAYILEHLLTALNPRDRVRANMYATPPAVAQWMINHALQELSLQERESAIVCDPAAGSAAILQLALTHPTLSATQIYGIELDPAAHAASTAVLGIQREFVQTQLILADALSAPLEEHVHAASRGPVVLLANPPFVGTAPLTRPITAELSNPALSYRPIGDEKFAKNPKWLNTLSLQFLQWMQRACLAVAARGNKPVMAVATHRALIEQPTFAAVRRSLEVGFDRVHVLDLHGTARQGLKSPNGERDQNVFEIQQGICLLLATVASTDPSDKHRATVSRADLWGTRAEKLTALSEDKVAFEPVAAGGESWRTGLTLTQNSRWQEGFLLSDAYTVLCPAPITGRDRLVFCRSEHEAHERIALLAGAEITDDAIRQQFLSESDEISIPALRDAARLGELRVTPWAYRAFDERFAIEHPLLLHRPRDPRVMDALRTRNTLAIVTRRQSPPERPWNYLLVVDKPACDGVLRADPQGTEVLVVRDIIQNNTLTNNANSQWIAQLSARIGQPVSEPHAFAYCVGVLADESYRQTMQHELTQSLPRVRWPGSAAEFATMVASGERIIAVHTAKILAMYNPKVVIEGWDPAKRIAIVHWNDALERIELGDGMFVANISEAMWRWTIGARRPCARWLQDRIGTPLTATETDAFSLICVRIAKLIE